MTGLSRLTRYRARYSGRVSDDMVEREIEFLAEIPKTLSGKMQRFLLRRHA
jgi:acyl-coenzyme A synthetase/AMP-(fatty) acid ligase